MHRPSLFLASVILAGSATIAAAGAKWQSTLSPVGSGVPTMSAKGSKASIDDKGNILVVAKAVTDAGGLVTTDGSFTAKTGPALSGDEYVGILHGTVIPLGVSFEFNMPLELKKGNGTAKFSAAALLALGSGQTIKVTGFDVYGPLGAANVASCAANVNNPALPRVNVDPNPNPCQQGSFVGTDGFHIP
ncbi:MAG TPA: hypothetical protein VFD84_13825 [Candidatus Binatia bacterium]|jgi:hypothetical protein|nr:hypothetical protein [Candidatus Binatia bacterium]